ncbi:hypothetical protein FLONG3_4295 [Fusarium longipes]|uniref:Uncharacterized protein n=1 Tax=Fusarium longipes TaxID=694270 RepID=A0A395SYN7_9HYPO|nr:hypothetical protein FLONG3_4295 [Fusarium longipes]
MTSTDETKTDDVPSERPRWLIEIEKNIEEQLDEFASESPYYEIVRDLLLAPQDSDSAVSDAANKFFDLYTADAEHERREPPEYMAGLKLNSIADIAFETVRDVSYTSQEHDRLLNFLVAIKNGAAEEYDTEDPKFVYHGWGLEKAAREYWNPMHVDGTDIQLAKGSEDIWTEGWINTSAFVAKLYRASLLPENGPEWLTWDFEQAFEVLTKGDINSNAGRQAQVLAVINYILIAGEVFSKDAKTTDDGRKYELNAKKWKLWASKIQEIYENVNEDARWDLKARAQKAYDKMVELYPEAFEGEKSE